MSSAIRLVNQSRVSCRTNGGHIQSHRSQGFPIQPVVKSAPIVSTSRLKPTASYVGTHCSWPSIPTNLRSDIAIYKYIYNVINEFVCTSTCQYLGARLTAELTGIAMMLCVCQIPPPILSSSFVFVVSTTFLLMVSLFPLCYVLYQLFPPLFYLSILRRLVKIIYFNLLCPLFSYYCNSTRRHSDNSKAAFIQIYMCGFMSHVLSIKVTVNISCLKFGVLNVVLCRSACLKRLI